MKIRLLFGALLIVIFSNGKAYCEEPLIVPISRINGDTDEAVLSRFQAPLVPPKDSPTTPAAKEPAKKDVPPPDTDLFAQLLSEGGEGPRGRNPRMIGDFPGYCGMRTILVNGTQTITTLQQQTTFQTINQVASTTILVPQIVQTERGPQVIQVPRVVQIPVSTVVPNTTLVPVTVQFPTLVKTVMPVLLDSGGAFKIGENENVHPEDRAYLTYNHFDGIQNCGKFTLPQTQIEQTTLNGQPATISTFIPGMQHPTSSLNREVFGIEKLILDRQTSIGLRVPLLQMHGDGDFNPDSIGDLSIILKHAFYSTNDGTVISGGLVVTVPTGQTIETFAGKIHPTILQPFVGYCLFLDRFYLQGFSSIAVPTDIRDVTVMFNDVAVGYQIYNGNPEQLVSSVTPTLEAHLTTPLSHQRGTDPITAPNLLALTGGVHLGIFQRSTLTLAVSTPVTAPRPFNIEAIAQFNYNY